jgi:hypothetical protein
MRLPHFKIAGRDGTSAGKGLSVASTSWPKGNPYLEDLSRLAERASLTGRDRSPGQGF